MGILFSMAWRNLWRHRTRTLLTSLALALAMVLVMWMLALYAGMFGTLRTILIDRGVGHVQVHHAEFPTRRGMYDTIPAAEDARAALEALPESKGAVMRLYGQALLGGETTTTGVELRGILPGPERAVNAMDDIIAVPREDLDTGRFLSETAEHEILLGKALAKELEVGVGDSVVAVTQDSMGGIGNDAYTVVGLVDSGDPNLDRAGALMHLHDLQALLVLEDQVHEIRVVGDSSEEASVESLLRATEGALPAASTPEDAPLLTRPWWTIDPMAQQMMGYQGVAQWIVMSIVLGLAAIGIVNTMLMSVLERTRELGVMRALGLKPPQIVLLILIEAVLIACLSAAIGLVLGLGAQAQLVYMGLDFAVAEGEGITAGGFTLPPVIYGRFSLGGIVQPVIASVVFSALAALWPAWRAARLRPVDAIRSE